MVITRFLMVMVRSFFLLMTLKEELPGWECGEAKQGLQPKFELSLTQFSHSLFVVISPYWQKCNPESLCLIAPPILWEYHGPDFLSSGDLSGICLAPDHDHGYGAVVYVCCMSDIISHIKGYMAVDIISDWRDPIGWLPMVMVIYGVSMNTDDWDKKNIKTLVWTGWAIPMTQSPGTHKMIRWSKRRELSKDDTCKSR